MRSEENLLAQDGQISRKRPPPVRAGLHFVISIRKMRVNRGYIHCKHKRKHKNKHKKIEKVPFLVFMLM